MKKLLSFAIFALFATSVLAQQEVTKFLGIPVDGTKSAMIEKLKAKGFTWNARMECLEGEFNGEEVYINVVTNNNKVWRIALGDKNERDEGAIRIRFNHLVSQFERNQKYTTSYWNKESQMLSDTENVSYEITVKSRQFEAVFYQLANGMDVDDMTLEDIASLHKRSVWFMISKGGYNKYRISMFYDNEYNHADGEDL